MTRRTRPTRAVAAGVGAAAGLMLGLPLGWLAAGVRRARREAAHRHEDQRDEPPFAAELAEAPRQPGEWL